MLVACTPEVTSPYPPKRMKRVRHVPVTKPFGKAKKIHEERKRIADEERETLNEFFRYQTNGLDSEQPSTDQ